MKKKQEKIIRFYFSNIGEPLGVFTNMDIVFSSTSVDADDFSLWTVFSTNNENEVIGFNSGRFLQQAVRYHKYGMHMGKFYKWTTRYI